MVWGPQWYLALYCFNFFLLGMFISSIGALIPFLSQERRTPLTGYSFLFPARTIGSIAAFFIFKALQRRQPPPNEHHIMAVSGVLFATFMVTFTEWDSRTSEWISIIALGWAYYWSFTCTNIGLMLVAKEKAGQWAPLGHAFIGVGALTVPQVIRYLSLDTYLYISPLYLVYSVLVYCLPSPEHPWQSNQKEQKVGTLEGTFRLQLIISVAIFLNMGIVMTVPTWLPVYAVMEGVADIEDTTIYGTLYWTTNVLAKMAMAVWSANSTHKITAVLTTTLGCGLICLILHYLGAFGAVVNFGIIVYGFSISSGFGLLLSLPNQYGIAFKPDQTANIMMWTLLAYGILTGLSGWLMKAEPVLLIYWLLLMSGVLLGTFWKLKKEMIALSSQRGADPPRELQEILVKI